MTLFAVKGDPLGLHPFVLGYEPIPEAMSVEGGDPARFLLEPVTAAAVVYPGGAWVLLDTGFNVDTVRDPERRAAQYNYDSYTAVVPPGDPLADQVRDAGLDWPRLAGCAISHLHLDHSGGLRLLEHGPPVVLQRAEWQFAATATRADAYAPGDYLRPGLDIRLIDGDTVLAPGLSALDTRGHTPGHQSFRVDLPGTTVVLACDAADLRVNITARRRCGWAADPRAAQRSVERLHELDRLDGVEVWPGHDPDWPVWRTRGLYPAR
ncbi:N-acyl homoserine lactonase family protein [Amycolatopsis thermoflava]|uniref:N-acyl homoserine lactonase family protein n=1 Tax=Amycolatopsis thermoflava TaxID=84480 RepID=UPI0003FA2CA3|nr:N-acyl homoserine lactonase family protein [Amycolatopsis thermoflava]